MALQPTLARPITFECGGPQVYSYEELLRAVAHEANIRPVLIPIPLRRWGGAVVCARAPLKALKEPSSSAIP